MNSLYDLALNLAKNRSASPSAIARVAQQTSDEAARWAFTQWSLRQRARVKFDRAEEMLFDRESLEMATHEQVAAYHASLFPEGVAVVDLTVGLGADLIALSRRGTAFGFEIDVARSEIARHNLRVHGVEAKVEVADGLEWLAHEQPAYLFADPARREGGRRTLDPSQFSPDPSEIVNKAAGLRFGVIKLSPMLPDPFLESLSDRIEFVSFGGECREALAMVGADAGAGRTAVLAETGERIESGDWIEETETPEAYIYEADPAAIRCHALPTLGERYDLKALGDSNGYLTGSEDVESPWLKGYRVLYTGRADLRETKEALANLGSSTPVVKQRGAGQDLEVLRKKLRMTGERELQLILYPVGKSVRHIVAESIGTFSR